MAWNDLSLPNSCEVWARAGAAKILDNFRIKANGIYTTEGSGTASFGAIHREAFDKLMALDAGLLQTNNPLCKKPEVANIAAETSRKLQLLKYFYQTGKQSFSEYWSDLPSKALKSHPTLYGLENFNIVASEKGRCDESAMLPMVFIMPASPFLFLSTPWGMLAAAALTLGPGIAVAGGTQNTIIHVFDRFRNNPISEQNLDSLFKRTGPSANHIPAQIK